MTNNMVIFGLGNESNFSRDEFHFFLDCLFRGLFKLFIVVSPSSQQPLSPHTHSMHSRRKPVPLNPGRKLASADIEKLVSQIFPSNIDILERSDFVEFMSSPSPSNKEVCELLRYFHERCLSSVGAYH
jgi:hypothetical protein